MITIHISKLLISLAGVVTLTGCMALALAPLVPVAGGIAPSSNKFEIDMATISPELKAAFSNAKSLTVLSTDATVVYMAEYLDKRGIFEVKMVEPPKGATPSQRRTLMRNTCRGNDRADLILSPSAGNTDAGSGTSNVGALLLGRAVANITHDVEVFRCRDNWGGKFTGKTSINQGFFNMDEAKINEILGTEIAKSIAQIAGKAK
jgi:hypothetical protein